MVRARAWLGRECEFGLALGFGARDWIWGLRLDVGVGVNTDLGMFGFRVAVRFE